MDYCPHDIEESIIDFFTSRLLHFSTKGSMRLEVQIRSSRPFWTLLDKLGIRNNRFTFADTNIKH